MKNTKTVEAAVGGFVIMSILAFIFLAYKVSAVNQVGRHGSYRVSASFASVSGLKKGAAVTLAGVKIGQVESISVDPEEYDAKVILMIDNQYKKIPIDSSVSVLTQGLLGEKYLGLDIGADDVYLEDGDKFEFAKSAIVLERLIDLFLLKKSNS